jgi:putative glutamine amidotransferase
MSKDGPVIGITTYGAFGEPPKYSLPRAYVDAVALAGGVPVLLAPNRTSVERLLDVVDGLLLPGGGDIAPDFHSNEDHPAIHGVSRERDGFELEMTKRALERPDLPVLGICRGMQVMNVSLGGDLELDIPEARGELVVHRLPLRKPTIHSVSLEAGSLLHEIYGKPELSVCSWHHQGVRRLGRGLKPIAYAEDGVIEGLACEEHPAALGVQWHPEVQIHDDPIHRRLFEWLVEQARRSK